MHQVICKGNLILFPKDFGTIATPLLSQVVLQVEES
jgi:hypothetical protein